MKIEHNNVILEVKQEGGNTYVSNETDTELVVVVKNCFQTGAANSDELNDAMTALAYVIIKNLKEFNNGQ